MKLYTSPGSPVCRPIAMFIADHSMEVEQQVVDLMAGEQYQPTFAAVNPNNAVPVLEDGEFSPYRMLGDPKISSRSR
jgi:glutathione S-transferase